MGEDEVKGKLHEIKRRVEEEFGVDLDEVRNRIDRVEREAREVIEGRIRWYERKLKEEARRIKRRRERLEAKKIRGEEYFIRFNLHFRIQHMVLFTSVIILIITGLPMKFPDFTISKWIVSLLGGIKISRLIHRVGASMLILFIVYHSFYTVFHSEGRRDWWLLLPRPKDLFDFFQNILYFFGKTDEKPKFDRFSYIEKFDYWAVYWGCLIMIGSGLLLWFEEISLKVFPKWFIDIAKEAHSDEAVLATLAIVIWHFYNVHFNPSRFPGTLLWLHGRISKEKMKEEHPLEYERMMKNLREKVKDDK